MIVQVDSSSELRALRLGGILGTVQLLGHLASS